MINRALRQLKVVAEAQPWFLAAMSGALYALSNIGFGFWPLALVCLCPLVCGLEATHKSLIKTWRLTFITACAIYVVGFPFLLSLAEGFIAAQSWLAWLLWGLYGLIFALSFSLLGCAYWLFRRLGFSALITLPMALVVAEALQFNLFPSYLGAGLIHSVFMAQAADLGGVYLLSAALALVNSGFYVFWHKKAHVGTVSLSSVVAIFGVIASLWLYGFVRHMQLADSGSEEPEGRAIKVGLIQSNLVGLDDDELSRVSVDEHIRQSKALLAREPVDLLVWPESAYVRGIRLPLPLDAELVRGDLEVPIIFGGTSVFQEGGRRVSGNTNFLIDEFGMIRESYTKQILIPFAEYLPFADTFEGLSGDARDDVDSLFPQGQTFVRGQSLAPLSFSGTRISTPICYEMIHPDYIQKMVAYAKPNVLLTLANDSWFAGSQEPMIHLSLARLRAIEHRRWVVRGANSGVSAIISPLGEVVAATKFGVQAALLGHVTSREAMGIFSRYGNWLLYLVGALVLLGACKRVKRGLESRLRVRLI